MEVKPSLLIDFDGPLSIALVALTGHTQPLRIKTDLWLSSSKTLEAVRDTDKDGKRPAKRLIEVQVNTRQPLVLFRYCAGKVSFFEQMQAKVVQIPGVPGDITSISGPVVYAPADWAALNIDVQVAPDASERLLPFLQSPKTTPQGATPELLKRLNQYVCLGTAKFQGSRMARPAWLSRPRSTSLKHRCSSPWR
ncbi:hypothetical protein [Pseudomonas rubra]|uniref:Uncharacterized protein n=1 Tax=Pseudomonas rubra TaxID=2942627 RepID=A0ABT5PC48_9PSED|nr:hypothetical protein [Pseudomonas rubra]MDD1015884.1 hypothetical protein [Pseudomonas rubra]MDD1040212.1 hypothetical protein [Pseudomonas rubra]MDD1157912.1 hypothetical protein [Pseudomonas rubra]